MYASMLRLHGHAVRVEVDGAAGLRAAAETEFDLVLLDIRLPLIDGMHVLTELLGNERTSGWPIVMLTNYDDPALRSMAHAAGARDYLIKSRVMPRQLAELVVEWVTSCA
jgi:DNA-binding response OmpR family regulator